MATHNPYCPKCGGTRQELEICPSCNGNRSTMFGQTNCKVCDNKDYVCPVHGKYWK